MNGAAGSGKAGGAKLFGLGVGPGDPELITVKALRRLRGAAVVVYPAPERGDSATRAIVADYLRPEQEELPLRMSLRPEDFPAAEVYERIAAAVGDHLAAGRDVAYVCEGDPFLYGSFVYLFERVVPHFPVEVVPGVSAPMACAAAAQRPLVSRNQVLAVIPAPLPAERIAAVLAHCDAAAILKLGRHFEKVRGVLHRAGLWPWTHYVERATTPAERVMPADAVGEGAVPYFSTLLVRRPPPEAKS